MYTRWTQHLKTEEEKQSFTKEIYSAKRVLEHILNLINEDKGNLAKSEENIKSYTVPNWDYLQAHRNGMRQYMSEVIRLVDLDQQIKPELDNRKGT